MELDLDALQALPGGQDTSEMQCTWTCSDNTCRDTCLLTG
ncbi:ALQxL family class IV lanthipeptide [Streptomyces malaysiense]|nr:ALQxL family class IV lanthipeptide [Streptomyces malaysiense]